MLLPIHIQGFLVFVDREGCLWATGHTEQVCCKSVHYSEVQLTNGQAHYSAPPRCAQGRFVVDHFSEIPTR